MKSKEDLSFFVIELKMLGALLQRFFTKHNMEVGRLLQNTDLLTWIMKRLPEEEVRRWRGLWAEVQSTLTRAEKKKRGNEKRKKNE